MSGTPIGLASTPKARTTAAYTLLLPLPSYFPPLRCCPIQLLPKSGHAFPHPAVILTFAAAGMFVLLALLPDLGHDQQWLLLAATRMGPHLNPYGPTVLESNPPLAIWLSALIVQLAALLHLPLTVTFKLAVTALAAAIAFLSAKLLRRLSPTLTRSQLWFLAFTFILAFGVLPARDFGQRDHILTLLILPYLLAAALHLTPQCLSTLPRTLITLAAALGLALKPHQALIPIAVELNLLLTARRVPHPHDGFIVVRVGLGRWPTAPRRLEPILFLLAALAYYTAIRLFAPTYLTEILPLLRDTYWAFGHLTFPQLLHESMELHLLAALTLLLAIMTKRGAPCLDSETWVPRTSPLLPILLPAACAATLAFYLQGTGWYYQQLPALTLFTFALALQLVTTPGAACLDPETWVPRSSWRLPILATALSLLALALTTHFSDFHRMPRDHFWQIEQPQPTPDPTFFANLPPNTPVATLTTSVDDTIPPAFRYHLTLAQRTPHLWLLPAILRNQSGPPPAHPIPPERLAALDRLQHTMMVEDLNRWHPTLILIARCQDPTVHCQVLEDRHDDLLAFFLRDPAFAAIFAHYHLLRTSGPYDAYTLN